MANNNSNKINILFFGIILILAFGVGVSATFWKNHAVISKLTVVGNNLITQEEIISLSEIKIPTKMYNKDLNLLRNKIKKEPYIQLAILQRDAPSRLIIKVEEREPVAIIANESGSMNYVDKEGFVLQLRKFNSVLDLPVIISNSKYLENKIEKNEKVQLPLYVLSIIKKVDTTLYKNISELKLMNQNKLLIRTTEQGLPIVLSQENIEESIVKLAGFFKTYEEHLFQTKAGYIDARFGDQIIVSPYSLVLN